MRPKARVIVCGILFWYPLAGVTYQFLHYLVGLRRLGYDVYYVEDSSRWVYDPRINDISGDASGNVDAVAPMLERHGFGGRWAFRGSYPGGRCYGMEEQQILRLFREVDALLNVTGAQELRDEHLCCPRRVYIESDPFATQVLAVAGDPVKTEALAQHDVHFSFGENLGSPECDVPSAGVNWLPTRQPVLLDMWEGGLSQEGAPYTTITTWHNKGKDVRYRGELYYWTKDREFLRFIDLPARRPLPLELATDVDADSRQRLITHGWRVRDALSVSSRPEAYRSYVQSSRGEFTVARDQYVRPRTGWFSDRSACYLAAGRPVVTQETGFSKYLTTGEGLFSFVTIDDVLDALDAIESDYGRHARAAREVAAEYFDAERVIASLMDRAGL